jgi:hypothetical protein
LGGADVVLRSEGSNVVLGALDRAGGGSNVVLGACRV